MVFLLTPTFPQATIFPQETSSLALLQEVAIPVDAQEVTNLEESADNRVEMATKVDRTATPAILAADLVETAMVDTPVDLMEATVDKLEATLVAGPAEMETATPDTQVVQTEMQATQVHPMATETPGILVEPMETQAIQEHLTETETPDIPAVDLVLIALALVVLVVPATTWETVKMMAL